jgi:secondary thiamine-phosphate synthase enzyme
MHTSAALTISENFDSEVPADLNTFLNRLAPDSHSAYRHSSEGADDMPAHIKSSMLGVSLTIPFSSGRLLLGTWQGIFLCEFRDHPSARKIVVTING